MKTFLQKHHHQVSATIYLLCTGANLFLVWWRWPDPFIAFSAFFAGITTFAAIDQYAHAWWLARTRREIDAEYTKHRTDFAVYTDKTIREVIHRVAAEHGMVAEERHDGDRHTRH